MLHAALPQTASPLTGAAQAIHMGPQRLASVSPAHSEVPGQEWNAGRHWMPHFFATQVALPPLVGREHSVAQSPQCFGSVLVSTQLVPHWVGIGSAQVALHPS